MKLKILSGLALAALLSCSAQAAIYTVEHNEATFGGPLYLGTTSGYVPTYSNTFDIAAAGYSIGANLAWGDVSFVVRDQTRNEAADENFTIDLDSLLFVSHVGQLPFANVTLGGALGLNFIATLESTGLLNYTITALQGSFRVKSATLTVETPDAAATISLLGLGLLGIAAIRRKMA